MRRATIGIAIMAASFAAGAGGAQAATRSSAHPIRAQAATRSSANPTRAQIRRAVSHAERSSYLWATVNICKADRGHGGLLGIRGEMTALGFRSTLSMTVQLRQYDRSRARYVWVKGTTARRTVSLGSLRTGVHQDGAEFHYSSATGLLDAIVTFTWTRDGRRLGTATRTTTAGHHTAAFADPPRYSAASCRL
ncbi:MAG TPA: hypothetical protein VKV21_01080 [Solirubrobacteraceae bacterium]|nr:hypothetical protein [Solirubrobacteraceae bacterium]